MQKLVFIIGILLLSVIFAGVAHAQEEKEERSYRFGIEAEPLRFVFFLGSVGVITNVGLEYYLFDTIGLRARGGGYEYELGNRGQSERFVEFGVSYYFDGVVNSGPYMYGFANSSRMAVSVTTTTEVPTNGSTVLNTVKLADSDSVEAVGGMLGHRWQGKRWYSRLGIGYATSRAVELKLKLPDDSVNDTYTFAGRGGIVYEFTLGAAF